MVAWNPKTFSLLNEIIFALFFKLFEGKPNKDNAMGNFYIVEAGGKTISTQLNFIEITFLYEYYYDPEILLQEYLQVGNS